MDTNAIHLSTRAIPGIPDPRAANPAAAPAGGEFGKVLANALADVQSLQAKAGQMAERMVSGEVTDVHQAMIASEEASVAFEMMMEIRNKLLEAYQEIMRMQV